MADVRLLAMTALSLATAALFAWVALLNARRVTHDAASAQAARDFVRWWAGLSVWTVLNAASTALVAVGVTSAPRHVALMVLGYPALAAALHGLLSYLLYVHTGATRGRSLLRAYHAALAIGLTLLLAYTRPQAVIAQGWGTLVEYARPLTGAWLALAVLAILGPVLVAAVAYGSLYRRTRDPQARRRIALVSASLTAWFGLSAAASILQLDDAWWPLAAKLLGLAATLLLLVAFRDVRDGAP